MPPPPFIIKRIAVFSVSIRRNAYCSGERSSLLLQKIEIAFDCSEKVFQVMKFADQVSRREVYLAKGQTMKMKAKHFEKAGTVRADWGEIIVDAMKFCIAEKYRQSAEFRQALEESRGLFIVEDQTSFPKKSPDTWGAKLSGDGTLYVGPNLMGRLLMELRDSGCQLRWSLPRDATLFQESLRV